MEKKTKEKIDKKILQVVNLSPSESWVEKIKHVHPMKQITIASIVQVFVLGLMAISMFGINNLFADERQLDLTLPETNFNYVQIKKDSLLIQDSINKRLRFIKIKNEPSKKTLTTYYILNTIDMTTSYYMTRNHPHINEGNFLLPEKPSAAEFLLHKSIMSPLIAANFQEEEIVLANWILAVVILKNLYIYNTTCRNMPNYHHVTGQNLNPC